MNIQGMARSAASKDVLRLVTWALLALAGLLASSCATPLDANGGVASRTIAISTRDGTAHARLFTPASKGRWPGVIVWPDLAGLRPVYDNVGRDLAAQGFVVLIPNSFYRSTDLDGTRGTGILGPEEFRTRLSDWRAAASADAIASDAGSYVDYLDSLDAVDSGRPVGVVGYNVGAAHALRAAAAVPGRIGAVAVAHPLGAATSRPDSPHLLIGQTRASYYAALAGPDDAREPDDKEVLKATFASAGLRGSVEVFDAAHGFALADTDGFDTAAAARFRQNVLALFKQALR